MDLFVCENVFIPLRLTPSHKSEMLSQVLFGESFVIIDRSGHWLKIRTSFDDYQGWIDSNHLNHSASANTGKVHVLNRSLPCLRPDDTTMVIEAGSEIYDPDYAKKTFFVGGKLYKTSENFSENYTNALGTLADTAMKFVNSPYIWGGRIPSGIDCSGLTQLVYKIHGKQIPRDSILQSGKGEIIDFIDSAEAGDLVFFDDERGQIGHVGMIISRGLVIHASGRVRIDAIDHQGIYRTDTGAYTHHLRMIRRLQVMDNR